MGTESRSHPDFTELRLLFESVPIERSTTLHHLLGCKPCLKRLLRLTTEGDSSEVEAISSGESVEDESEEVIAGAEGAAATVRPVQRLLNRSTAIGKRRESDRRAAPALYDEVMEVDEGSRTELIRSDPRYASPGLGELLLRAAGDLARNAPARAVELARLALEVAERVDSAGYGEDAAVALSVTGWSRVAEALQLGADDLGAAEALRLAEQAAEAAPIEARERALYCRVAALVRQGEGRIDEALGLSLRAAELHRQWDEQDELAEALAEIGWMLAADDPLAAVEPLREALDLISPETRPWPAFRIRQVLALCYLELGKRREAAELMLGSIELREGLREPLDRLQLAWTDALISDRLDRPAAAIKMLRSVIRGFVELGKPFDAALAAIDAAEMCVLWQRDGDLKALLDLVYELPARLPRTPGVVLTMAWRLLGHREAASPIMLAAVRDYLRRARHDPRRRYQPSRRPLRAVAWDRLSPEERRAICDQAGAGAETAEQSAINVAPYLRDLIGWFCEELVGTRIEWEMADGAAA